MGESIVHASLVRAIVRFAACTLGELVEIAVWEDAIDPLRGEKPPKLGGYVPDVFATDVPTTTTLIGEAKTRKDVETQRSRSQIVAFLRYLAATPRGIFVLSVPLGVGGAAQRLLEGIDGGATTEGTRMIILDSANIRLL